VQGDITNITADALVHPTNTSFAMMGEVGQALEKKGGKDFLQEVHDLRSSHGSLDSTTGMTDSTYTTLMLNIANCLAIFNIQNVSEVWSASVIK
jgi:histone H2A